MSNPALLFLDTDVLFQIFISTTAHKILSVLKRDYGICSVVVDEVYLELMQSPKFRGRFKSDMRKASGAGVIQRINSQSFAKVLSTNLQDPKLIGVSYADTQIAGQRYNVRVGRGEAYTHAMACALQQPAASNDVSALRVLAACCELLPKPVLRFFDLIAFAFQIGLMTDADCDDVRASLLDENEWIPSDFRNASFSKGITTYRSRLVDANRQSVGSSATTAFDYEYKEPLFVSRISTT